MVVCYELASARLCFVIFFPAVGAGVAAAGVFLFQCSRMSWLFFASKLVSTVIVVLGCVG